MLILVGVICSFTIHAQTMQVSSEEATTVAISFFKQKYPSGNDSLDRVVFYCNERGNTLMYEALFSNKRALLMSGHKACHPILGDYYSGGASLIEQLSEQALLGSIRNFIGGYIEQLNYIFESGDTTPYYTAEWFDLLKGRDYGKAKSPGVGPLIETIWGQSTSNNYNSNNHSGDYYSYNYHIPAVDTCTHALVGCVAVAMGQIMNYWQMPVLELYLEKQFDWCKMKNSLNTTSPTYTEDREAVSYLLAECAKAVDMDYGCTGSGTTMGAARNALEETFHYSSDIDLVNRFWSFMSDASWKAKLKSDLNAGRPVLYAANRYNELFDWPGHAFVCDGYEDDKFHINWGWRGFYDGLFLIDSLHPKEDCFYKYNHSAIFNIHPQYLVDICNYPLSLFNYYHMYYDLAGNETPEAYENVPATATVLYSAPVDPVVPEEWHTIPSGVSAEYVAHKEVVLLPNFTVERGADFVARIEPCARCEDRFVQGQAPQVGLLDDIDGDVSDVRVEQSPSQAFTMPSQVQLFPNPTSENVTIVVDGEVESVVVYNTMGMPVGGWRIRALSVQQVTLDMSSMSSGMYIVVVKKTDGQVVYERIIKN